MRTFLTPNLLGFLIERGYNYCLAKIKISHTPHAITVVTLTPVKYNPGLEALPREYDVFFKMTREPIQMALGVVNTEVYVNLNFKKRRRLSRLNPSIEAVSRAI